MAVKINEDAFAPILRKTGSFGDCDKSIALINSCLTLFYVKEIYEHIWSKKYNFYDEVTLQKYFFRIQTKN